MEKEDLNNVKLSSKVLRGMHIAFDKLVMEKARNDQEFVFADKDGKIFYVKAKDLLKEKEV